MNFALTRTCCLRHRRCGDPREGRRGRADMFRRGALVPAHDGRHRQVRDVARCGGACSPGPIASLPCCPLERIARIDRACASSWGRQRAARNEFSRVVSSRLGSSTSSCEENREAEMSIPPASELRAAYQRTDSRRESRVLPISGDGSARNRLNVWVRALRWSTCLPRTRSCRRSFREPMIVL